MNQQVAETFKKLHFGKRTGVLTCASDDVQRAVYFQSGFVVRASSSDSEDRLGEVMIRHGRITKSDFEDASHYIQRGWLLGETLAELSMIEEHEIEVYVRHQLLDITCMLLTSPPKRLTFTASHEVDACAAPLSVADILIEAVRRSETSGERAKALVEADCTLGFPSDPIKRFQDVHLTSEEGFVLSRVDGVETVSGILALSPLPDEETGLVLLGLLEAELIEREGEGVAAPEAGPEPEPMPEPESVPLPNVDDEVGSEAVDTSQTLRQEHSREQERAGLELLYQEIQFRDHWQVLNVDRDATPPQVKEAYFRGAKKYHPDRFRQITEPEFQEKLSFVFRRFSEAYETLSTPESLESYERLCSQESSYLDNAPSVSNGRQVMSAKARADEAAAIHSRAEYAFTAGDHWECIELTRECVELAPDVAGHYNLMGRALAHNPKWRPDAQKNLKIAMNLDPFNARYVLDLAKLYEHQGLHLRAQRALDKAQSIDPSVQSEN